MSSTEVIVLSSARAKTSAFSPAVRRPAPASVGNSFLISLIISAIAGVAESFLAMLAAMMRSSAASASRVASGPVMAPSPKKFLTMLLSAPAAPGVSFSGGTFPGRLPRTTSFAFSFPILPLSAAIRRLRYSSRPPATLIASISVPSVPRIR